MAHVHHNDSSIELIEAVAVPLLCAAWTFDEVRCRNCTHTTQQMLVFPTEHFLAHMTTASATDIQKAVDAIDNFIQPLGFYDQEVLRPRKGVMESVLTCHDVHNGRSTGRLEDCRSSLTDAVHTLLMSDHRLTDPLPVQGQRSHPSIRDASSVFASTVLDRVAASTKIADTTPTSVQASEVSEVTAVAQTEASSKRRRDRLRRLLGLGL